MATPTTITETKFRSWCSKIRTDTSGVGVRLWTETESFALFTTSGLTTGSTSRGSDYGRDLSMSSKPAGEPTSFPFDGYR